MFFQVFAIIFPVLMCALIGFIWAKTKRPFDTATVGQLVMNIGAPCLVISTLSRAQLDVAVFWHMAWLTLIIIACTLVMGVIAVRLWKLEIRTYLPSVVFVNTGNLGLPLCLFAFGEEGLAYGIAFFMVMSVLHFSLGLALVSGEGVLKTLVKNPIVHSVWIAVLLLVTQWSLPVWVMNTVDLLGQFSIPLMLLALGVSLASLAVEDMMTSLKFAILRVLGGCFIGWAVCEVFAVEGTMRGVLILQSSMPVAVFNYLLASQYQRSPQAVAGIVVASTLVAFLVLPFVLWLVL
ncbi:MAG: AEC family transporter [Pseudomonadales bacterium]|nr:AEC family transporter [Pseudomonadales bacterium]